MICLYTRFTLNGAFRYICCMYLCIFFNPNHQMFSAKVFKMLKSGGKTIKVLLSMNVVFQGTFARHGTYKYNKVYVIYNVST